MPALVNWMNFLRLENRIKQDEGFSSQVYPDTQGIPTIGYGSTKLFGTPVTWKQVPITVKQATIQLRADIYGAIVDAHDLFPRIEEMNAVRQEVLVNMAYNLGRDRLSKFHKLRYAANKLDYPGMAREMLDSAWYSQVGERSRRLVKAMKHGQWTQTDV